MDNTWQAIKSDKYIFSGHSWKNVPYFVQQVYDQEGDPICAAVSVGYLIEFHESRILLERAPIEMSTFVDKFSEKTDADNIVKVVNKIRDPKASMDVYGLKNNIRKLTLVDPIFPNSTASALTVDQMITRLESGPFIAVIKASKEFRNYKDSFGLDNVKSCYRPKSSDKDTENPLHALLVIGYRMCKPCFSTQTHLLVKNSWGATWGNEGYGWIYISDSNPMQFGHEIYGIEWIKVDQDSLPK